MAGYIVWCATGTIFLVLGIYCLKAKEPARFWANADHKLEVSDVKAYNRAMSKMWFVFLIVYLLLGLPLLNESEEAVPLIIFVSCFGVIVACIGLMLYYVFGIERKFCKK